MTSLKNTRKGEAAILSDETADIALIRGDGCVAGSGKVVFVLVVDGQTDGLASNP